MDWDIIVLPWVILVKDQRGLKEGGEAERLTCCCLLAGELDSKEQGEGCGSEACSQQWGLWDSCWDEQGYIPERWLGVALLTEGEKRLDKGPAVMEDTGVQREQGLCALGWYELCFGTSVIDYLHKVLVINWHPGGVLFKSEPEVESFQLPKRETEARGHL